MKSQTYLMWRKFSKHENGTDPDAFDALVHRHIDAFKTRRDERGLPPLKLSDANWCGFAAEVHHDIRCGKLTPEEISIMRAYTDSKRED